MIKVSTAAGTHIGCVRHNNEDNFYINGFFKENTDEESCFCADNETRDVYTFAVCDGVGGESCGELASLLAVQQLKEFDGKSLCGNLMEYAESANDVVCGEIREKRLRMATTVAILTISGENVSLCNMGDSRIYLYRDGELTQVSHDHTRLQRMVDSGAIRPEDAKLLKKDHVLTQFLGVFPQEFMIEPYIDETVKLHDGDIFLLCSDGLSDMVEDDDICQLLQDHGSRPPEEIVDELTDAALEGGGRDNITTIVVKIEMDE